MSISDNSSPPIILFRFGFPLINEKFDCWYIKKKIKPPDPALLVFYNILYQGF